MIAYDIRHIYPARRSYVRQQNDQADNQGLQKRGNSASHPASGPIFLFSMVFFYEIRNKCSLFLIKNLICRIDCFDARHILMTVRERVPIRAAYGGSKKKVKLFRNSELLIKECAIELPEWADSRTDRLDMFDVVCNHPDKSEFIVLLFSPNSRKFSA